jgi:hypothetical protein
MQDDTSIPIEDLAEPTEEREETTAEVAEAVETWEPPV